MTFSQSDLSILSQAHCINAVQSVVNANFWLKSHAMQKMLEYNMYLFLYDISMNHTQIAKKLVHGA